jgi:hypothetical protein
MKPARFPALHQGAREGLRDMKKKEGQQTRPSFAPELVIYKVPAARLPKSISDQMEAHGREAAERCRESAAEWLRGESLSGNAQFEEPYWPVRPVLNYIAFGRVDLLTINDDDARSLRFQAIYRKIDNGATIAVREKNPVHQLMAALRRGKLQAIGPDHQDLPPPLWSRVSHDLSDWPDVLFRRDDVLRLWRSEEAPAVEVETSASPPAPAEKRNLKDRIADEIKRRYPDGRPPKTNKQLAGEMKCSVRTVNRALSKLGWSLPRAK